MIILSAPIDETEVYDTEGYFQSPSSKDLFAFKIEVNDEGSGLGFIRLYDSVGRMVPVDFDNLGALTETLARLNRYIVERTVAEELALENLNNVPTLLEDELAEIRSVLAN